MRNWIRQWIGRDERYSPRTVARRLEWLFANQLRAEDIPYTINEIEEITARLGRRVDASTIERLRHGMIKRPALLDLRGVASAFGLPNPRLLFDEHLSDEDFVASVRAISSADDPTQQLIEQAAPTVKARLQALIDQDLMKRPSNLDVLYKDLCYLEPRLAYDPDSLTDEEVLALVKERTERVDMLTQIFRKIAEVEAEERKNEEQATS